MPRSLALLVLALAVAPSAAGQSVTQRVIEEFIPIHQPLDRCALPGTVWRMARSVGIPAGIESWPGSCRPEPRTARNDLEPSTLAGLTVGEALDTLVARDPRFWWIEQDGVIVVRPVRAWADRDHFLHRTVASFSVLDQHLGGALDAIGTALGPFRFSGGDLHVFGTPDANKPFTVNLGATSILDARTAVARSHGSLVWRVTYCRSEARHENATIWLTAHDGAGRGRHTAVLVDPNGRWYDACADGFR